MILGSRQIVFYFTGICKLIYNRNMKIDYLLDKLCFPLLFVIWVQIGAWDQNGLRHVFQIMIHVLIMQTGLMDQVTNYIWITMLANQLMHYSARLHAEISLRVPHYLSSFLIQKMFILIFNEYNPSTLYISQCVPSKVLTTRLQWYCKVNNDWSIVSFVNMAKLMNSIIWITQIILLV